MASALLDVRGLTVQFLTDNGLVTPVDGVSLTVEEGETLGVVGESGCGKSVTALSIMRLVSWPPGRIAAGSISLDGEDILAKTEPEMQRIRGRKVSMIFQDPMTSLNPVLTIGEQVMETLILHERLDRKAARVRAIDLLRAMGIPSPERRMDEYPHQLSGGMRQRVMIAMAVACNPKLLIADEPTTALDVTIQAQILDLMRRLRRERGTAIILITHDLGIVAEMASRVAVMYAGQVVEIASAAEMFRQPCHPYSKGLLGSVPRIDENTPRLRAIKGVVPSLFNIPKGCRFAPRCSLSTPQCTALMPDLVEISPGHFVRCFNPCHA